METSPRSSHLKMNDSANGAPIRFIGKEMLLKVAADATDGAFSIMEDRTPPGGGPPLHSHHCEEWFYIVDGEFLVEVDGATSTASPGDLLHVAPDVPHTFQNIGSVDGRMLIVAKPGGIESYFMELAERMMADPSNLPALGAIAAKYGVVLHGPPIGARKKN